MIFLWNRFYYENEWNHVGFNHQNEFLINKLMEDNLKILIVFYFEKKIWKMWEILDNAISGFFNKYTYLYSVYCINHTILWTKNVSSWTIYIFQCPSRFIRFDPSPTKTICPQYSVNDPSSHEWIFCMISNFNIFFIIIIIVIIIIYRSGTLFRCKGVIYIIGFCC